MSTSNPTIPPDVAAHVLFHFGHDGGYQAGSFTTHLIVAIDSADPSNKARLAAGFPEYVAAVTAIQYDRDAVGYLQRIVRGEAATEESPVPQCPEALLNPDTGDLRRCVQQGRHGQHQTPSGTQWTVPVDVSTDVPF
jgi:hypothetical protein